MSFSKQLPHVVLRQTIRSTLQPPLYGFRRTFASSASRQSAFLDVVTTPPMVFMETLHACSVPWWAIIPSTALAVRGLVYLLTVRRSHQRARIRNSTVVVARAQLETETLARRILKFQNVLDKEPALSSQSFLEKTPMAVQLRATKIARKIAPDLFKRAYLSGTTRIAAWLLANEAIRMKLGMSTALLRAMYEATITRTTADAGHTLSHFDADTQVQGLFWCTDLTVADPTGILQGSLALLTMTMLLAPTRRAYTATWRAWLLNIQQSQWTFALCMGVVYAFVWNMPAGLHLYWLSSALIAKAQTSWLQFKQPLDPLPRKCKQSSRQVAVAVFENK